MSTKQSRSGQIELAIPSFLNASVPLSWQAVCSLVETTVRPRVLRVQIYTPVPTAVAVISPVTFSWSAGWYSSANANFSNWPDLAVLRLRYGTEGVERLLELDLASGEYVLPPCNAVRVDVGRYSPPGTAGTQVGGKFLVTGSIEDGDGTTDFRPMVATARCLLAAGASIECQLPAGTYALDVQPVQDGTWSVAAGNAPIIEVGGAGVYCYRDFNTGLSLGGIPAPVAGGNDANDALTNNVTQVTNLGSKLAAFRIFAFKR